MNTKETLSHLELEEADYAPQMVHGLCGAVRQHPHNLALRGFQHDLVWLDQ